MASTDNIPLDIVDEGSHSFLTFTPTGEDGSTAIPLAQISSMTLTLKDRDSEEVINSRNGTAIVTSGAFTGDPAGSVTDGVFKIVLTPDDNAIQDSTLPRGRIEIHDALIYTKTTSDYERNKAIEIRVRNLQLVTSE